MGGWIPGPSDTRLQRFPWPDDSYSIDIVLKTHIPTLITPTPLLRYVAYGKVKDGQCQHGPRECLFNRYINCAQELHSQQRDWFPYVQCLAGDLAHIEDKAPGCASARGWRHADLEACATGSKGQALELVAGQATQRLEPKLTNVPWVRAGGGDGLREGLWQRSNVLDLT